MLICDIGNSSFHFYDTNNDKNFKLTNINDVQKYSKERVFYINVNDKIKDTINGYNWIDCEPYFDKFSKFKSLGVDRKAVIVASTDSVILDFGTAITVDVVKDGEYKGGYIYAGIFAMRECYKNISERLNYDFNFNVDLNNFPTDTRDAISYGFIEPLYKSVINIKNDYNLPLILTGGGAKDFKSVFTEAAIDELLVFKGILKSLTKSEVI